MYKHQITIEVDDNVVHRYSIIEWETILLSDGVIDRDELPLSYGRIAEILAEQLYKYRYFQGVNSTDWKMKEDTTYTNDAGYAVGTKVPLGAKTTAALMMAVPEPGTIQIGIANYRNDPKHKR